MSVSKKEVIISIALCFSLAITAAAVDIVKGGAAKASIVIPTDATGVEKLAASEFAGYVKKITGAELQVGTNHVAGLVPVRFGIAGADSIVQTPALKKETDKLQEDGFVIDAGAKGVQIVAKNKHAIHFGNFYVIRKYGGVYWFAPDDEEYVPQNADFTIPDQLTLKNPAIMPTFQANGVWTTPRRTLFMAKLGCRGGSVPPVGTTKKTMKEQYDFAFKMGSYDDPLSEGGYLTPLLVPGWSMPARLKLFQEHPEYFGLRKGKRVLSEGERKDASVEISQPCTSNPEVVKRITQNIMANIDEARGNSGRKVHFTFIDDDHACWCECDNCRKLDDPNAGPEGKDSDRWWTYVNAVAKQLIDKYGDDITITVFAYQTFRDPPKIVKPISDPRIAVKVCPHGRCYLHTLTDASCSYNAKYLKMYEDWWKLDVPVSSFEYFCVMPGPSCYIPVERKWIADLKYFVAHNRGNTMPILMDIDCGEIPYIDNPHYKQYKMQNIWPSLWQLCWLTGYFAWEPDADYEKVWDDVSAKYYGAAWEYIRPYRLLLEKALSDAGSHASYSGNVAPLGKAYDMPGFAPKAEELLDKAVKAVEMNPVVLKRVVKEKEYFTKNYKESGFSNFGKARVTVAKTAGKITLDGKLDEVDWVKAYTIEEFFGPRQELTVGSFKNDEADPRTKVKALFDDDNVYFGIEALKSAGKVKDSVPPDGKFPWDASHIEVFIMPQDMASKGQYYQIAFARNGYVYSAFNDSVKGADLGNKLDFEYKVSDAPDRWFAEVKIPAGKLGGVKNGAMWKVNVARAALQKNGKMQNTSLSSGGGFHSLAKFKVFVFGGGAP